MDQAQNLRNIIKKDNIKPVSKARVITVTSGKGGVGKSSISINLAITFARRGKKVIILDADFGLANIEVMLGIRPQYSLADLMFRGKSLTDIICEGPEGVGFISGGSGIQEMLDLTQDQLLNLTRRLSELDDRADIVIIDTGAGISESVMEFVMLSEEILLVATPEPTSITDAYALLKTFGRKPDYMRVNSKVELIANRVSNAEDGMELYQKLSSVSEKFLDISLKYMGAIPFDKNISKAVMQQKPIAQSYPNSPAYAAIEDIADRVLGDKVFDLSRQRKGLAELFMEVFRRAVKKSEE